ncbi:hypothetical protein MW887_008062 [Aspergillus wentii]|nr:hypothetical protein MW887_008062 [Aspergillus wentii]
MHLPCPRADEPVKSGPFTYGGKGITLYEIPFQKSSPAAQLKATLETAVKTGKCNSIAPSVASIEELSREKCQEQLNNHDEVVKKWRAAEFSKLKSPSDEAYFDPSLFIAKYSLESLDGPPDMGKQNNALILKKVSGRAFEMAVQRIPGLVARITRDLTVIGWENSIERGLDSAFATISSDCQFDIRTTESNFDFDRFMAKFFLDGLNGKPNPRKYSEPIDLYPFLDQNKKLEAAAASIPGLKVCRVKGRSSLTFTIVGWDSYKLVLKKKEFEEERAREEAEEAAEKKTEMEERWQETLKPIMNI